MRHVAVEAVVAAPDVFQLSPGAEAGCAGNARDVHRRLDRVSTLTRR